MWNIFSELVLLAKIMKQMSHVSMNTLYIEFTTSNESNDNSRKKFV